MLFSVIIPTYNNLELFSRALDSVLCQNEQSFEVIVVDDSPTDLISIFVKSLSNSRIRYYHNRPSKGAVPNWNYGLSLCLGEYIILLHHDEAFVGRDYLKELRINAKDKGVVVSNVVVYCNGQIKRNRIIKYCKRIVFAFPSLFFLVNPIGPTACVCVKRDSLQSFNDNLVWLVDVEWYYRLFKTNKIAICDAIISSIFGHNGQITKNINIKEEEAKDIVLIREDYKNRITVLFALFLRKILFRFK